MSSDDSDAAPAPEDVLHNVASDTKDGERRAGAKRRERRRTRTVREARKTASPASADGGSALDAAADDQARVADSGIADHVTVVDAEPVDETQCDLHVPIEDLPAIPSADAEEEQAEQGFEPVLPPRLRKRTQSRAGCQLQEEELERARVRVRAARARGAPRSPAQLRQLQAYLRSRKETMEAAEYAEYWSMAQADLHVLNEERLLERPRRRDHLHIGDRFHASRRGAEAP
jgi:hypothetical protein